MVTDEALIAETAVWPNFFLTNIFFALKGSKLFIIFPLFLKIGETFASFQMSGSFPVSRIFGK